MVESRKQVEVAKEQSAKLAVANLEQEVGTLRMERDKYKGFWLEVKVKAETDQAKLNNKKQTVKLVNFDHSTHFGSRQVQKTFAIFEERKGESETGQVAAF